MQLKGDTHTPLKSAEFNELMAGLDIDRPAKMAVAVSGGADSMALALLLNDWCLENTVKLIALTVNHGLREEAAQEADQVAEWLSLYNIEHQTLEWHGEKPSSNIQSDARNARYKLMAEYATANEIDHLFLAHHKDDQAETFLIRLLRGSGVDGLSAMDPVSDVPIQSVNGSLKLCRPFLDIDKKRLLATLESKEQRWIDDPSNENASFTRVKIRELLKESNLDGLDPDRLSSTAKRMSRVKSLLDELTGQAESDYLFVDELGFATLKPEFHQNLHEEIALRLLARIFKKIGGNHYTPRYVKLIKLYNEMTKVDFKGCTLAGVEVLKTKNGPFVFVREYSKITDEIIVAQMKQYLWDNRFLVETQVADGMVTAFTQSHIDRLSEIYDDFKGTLYNIFDDYKLRDKLLPTLPVLILKDGKVILPELLTSKLNLEISENFSAVFNK